MGTLLDYLDNFGGLDGAAKKFKSLSAPFSSGPERTQGPAPAAMPVMKQPAVASSTGGMGANLGDMFAGWAQGGNDWQRSLGLGAANMIAGKKERAALAKADAEKKAAQEKETQRLMALQKAAVANGVDPSLAMAADTSMLGDLLKTQAEGKYKLDATKAELQFKADQEARTKALTEQQNAKDLASRRAAAIAAGISPDIANGLDAGGLTDLIGKDFTNDADLAKAKAAAESKAKSDNEMRTFALKVGVSPDVVQSAPVDELANIAADTYKAKNPNASPADIKDELALSKDFENQPGISNYRITAPIMASMANSMKDGSAISDLDFVYGVAKILDPTSVVRDGERVMMTEQNSLPGWVVGALQKAITGGTALTDPVRKNMFALAHRRVTELEGQAKREFDAYSARAKKHGMDPSVVFNPLDPLPPAGDYVPPLPTYKVLQPEPSQATPPAPDSQQMPAILQPDIPQHASQKPVQQPFVQQGRAAGAGVGGGGARGSVRPQLLPASALPPIQTADGKPRKTVSPDSVFNLDPNTGMLVDQYGFVHVPRTQ